MKLYYIDANSQFSYQPSNLVNGFQLQPEPLGTLVATEAFSFGHFVYGDNHNAFAVHPKHLSPEQAKALGQDISEKLRQFRASYGLKHIDLLLYPIESSAEYFVDENRTCFNAKHEARLTPAFREFGRRELKIQPRFKKLNITRQAVCKLTVVFFDDSISSGVTERNAIDAVRAEIEATFQVEDKVSLYWYTYTIVRRSRGAPRTLPAPSGYVFSPTRQLMLGSGAFCDVPHESVTQPRCLFCEAAARLHVALHWSGSMNPGARSALGQVYELARPHQSDLGSHFRPILDTTILAPLLALHTHAVYDACQVIEKEARSSPQWTAAAAFYYALNYHDARAYVAAADMRTIWLALLKSPDCLEKGEKRSEVVKPCEALLLMLALLPTSELRELAKQVELWNHLGKLPHAYGLSACALIVGNEYNLFASRAHVAGFARSLKSARHRQLQAVAEFSALMGEQESPLLPHLVALTSPHDRGAAAMARSLAVRLYRGAHDSYIYNEIDCMTPERAQEVVASVRQVLSLQAQLMIKLGMSQANQVEPENVKLNEALNKLLAAATEDDTQRTLDELKEQCEKTVDQFWRLPQSLTNHLVSFSEVHTHLKRAIERAFERDAFVQAGLDRLRERLVKIDLPEKALTLLILNELEIEGVFRNLLENPFYHFDDESDQYNRERRPAYLLTMRPKLEKLTAPLLLIDCWIDRFQHNLVLRFLDRARPAQANELYLRQSMLANSKHQMELIDGDVEWQAAEEEHPEYKFPRVDPEAGWRNAFYVRFPIVLYEELYPRIPLLPVERQT